MDISVIVPLYNEAESLPELHAWIKRVMDANNYTYEVLFVNDGSTDNTLANLRKYKEDNPELNLSVVANKGNKGVAWTKNRLLKSAKGEWFHVHDSDDWVYTDLYNRMISEWLTNRTDADVVCMDLEVNGGWRYPLNENTQRVYCAQISRFIKRDFVKGITFPENIKAGDDWYFAEELLTRNPKIVYSGVMAYHYNFPREGSLSYLQLRGLI